MAGIAGMSQSALGGLKESLASQSAPANPQTPTDPSDRKDPSEATSIDLQRIRASCDKASKGYDDADPHKLLVDGMSACVTRLMASIHFSDAVDVLLERLFPLSSPQLKQRLQMMYTPISPPVGPAGGAQGPGLIPGPNQGPAGGATGQPPGGGSPSMPGDAGVATLPA
jgi:hypothetical protein